MGKSLIIKGADFSQNAIDSVWNEITPEQGYAITNPNNAEYGKLILTAGNVNNSLLVKIRVPAGASMTMFVENNGYRITDLNLGYITSISDVSLTQGTMVPNIVTTHHPADSALRQSDGGFLLNNSTANALYFYINICYDVINGPELSATGKRILYAING